MASCELNLVDDDVNTDDKQNGVDNDVDEENDDSSSSDLPASDSGLLLRISQSTILFLSEISDTYLGRTIRTHGFALEQTSLTPTGHEGDFLIIEHQQYRLFVDTSLIPPEYCFVIGSLYRFIGELTISTSPPRHVLRARVATCVDGLDCDLYHRTVILFRKRVLNGFT